MTTFLPAQCFACTRLDRSTTVQGEVFAVRCQAYPQRIPDDFRTYGADHRQPRGDEVDGLHFNQADGPDTEQAFADWQAFHGQTLVAAADVMTGAMIALIPSDEDLVRLAVDGGEPLDQLHTTMLYLGDAADWTLEDRQAVLDAMAELAGRTPPVESDGFALDLFNPTSDERDTCIVLGLSGQPLADLHTAVEDLVQAGPVQHAPWIPHLTLIYTDDHKMLPELVDRTGPVVFDRIRVAFAGENTDIPLAG